MINMKGASSALALTRREELIAVGMPICVRMAYALARRLPPSFDRQDLIGAGHVGLLTAVDFYDASRGEFVPYAIVCIRGAMFDELRAMDHLTRHAREMVNRIQRAVCALSGSLGREPTEDEIAAYIEYDQVMAVFYGGSTVAQFREAGGVRPVSADPDELVSDWLAPDAALLAREERAALAEAIATLPARKQEVVRLFCEEERAQDVIARKIGVHESRVSQILREVAARLRTILDPSGESSERAQRAASSRRVELSKPDAIRYGSWTVIREVEQRHGHRYFWCRCDCGVERAVCRSALRGGYVSACSQRCYYLRRAHRQLEAAQ